MIGNPKIITLDEYHLVVEAKLGSKDFKIVSLEEAPFEQRVGLLADHARVHVGVDLPGGRREKLTFFAKGLPTNENCRALVEEHGFFEKEKFFYEVLAKHFDRVPLSTRTYPTCYLLKPGVFVLEDLGALGFKPVKSNLDAVDLDHCYQVLAALARFHCASIATEENLQKTLRDAYPEYMFESWFVKEGRPGAWWRWGLEAARTLLPLLPQYKDDPAAVQRLQDRIRGLGATLLHFFQIDTRRRNVFCHGDAWISNFLFTYQQEKPDKAVLLDFQLMRYAPPVYDVQLFLHMSLPYKDDRCRQMALLLGFYYDRLQDEVRAAGLDPDAVLPEAEFLETSRDAARMATIVVVLYSQICDMPADFIKKLFSDDAFYNAYVCGESRVEHVTDVFRTDKHFRWVFQNALGNLAKMLDEENK